MSLQILTGAILLASTPAPMESAPPFDIAIPAMHKSMADTVQPTVGSSSQETPSGADDTTDTEPAASLPGTTPPALPDSQPLESEPGDVSDIIIVTASPGTPGDPLEDLNAQTFEIAQSIDQALVGPVAFVYNDVVPKPVRKGLHNFLYNLGEPVVFVNFLLQLKIGKAAETLGRFAINSTVGVAGIFDVAKKPPINLPHRPNGFAYTLGYYGVDTGPYFYLPLIGPTTARDLTGRVMDLMFLPLTIGKPFNDIRYTLPAGTLNALDDRIEFDDKLKEIRSADDPYTAMREYYLKQRQAEIDELRGIHREMMTPAPDLPSVGTIPVEPGAQPIGDAAPAIAAPITIVPPLAPVQAPAFSSVPDTQPGSADLGAHEKQDATDPR